MMRRVLCMVGCFVATATAAQAPQFPLTGQVLHATNATPLVGVFVEVESYRRVQPLASPTDADGRFACDLATLFEPKELKTPALALYFSKPGFRKTVRVLQWPPRGTAADGLLTVPLEALGRTALLTPQQKTALQDKKSVHGQTVYWLPYTFPPTGLTSQASLFNEHFPPHLKRTITRYLQALPGVPDISLQVLPLKLQTTDTEQMMAYGQYLNGLAMVSGQGSAPGNATTGDMMHVVSQYLIIPWLEELGINTIYIDDTVPTEELLSAQRVQTFHTFWGRSTLLALSVRGLLAGRLHRDKQAVVRARSYLIEELRDVGPGNDHLVSALRSVLRLVDRTLTLLETQTTGERP